MLWIAAIALIAVGVAGTILPAIPGVDAGVRRACCSPRGSTTSRASPCGSSSCSAVLTALAWAVDYFAAAAGAKKAGASKLAVAGALIGTLAGIFTGLWGLLFMPLVGAAVGEFIAQRDLRRAGTVGIGDVARRCCSAPPPRWRSSSRWWARSSWLWQSRRLAPATLTA